MDDLKTTGRPAALDLNLSVLSAEVGLRRSLNFYVAHPMNWLPGGPATLCPTSLAVQGFAKLGGAGGFACRAIFSHLLTSLSRSRLRSKRSATLRRTPEIKAFGRPLTFNVAHPWIRSRLPRHQSVARKLPRWNDKIT